ncbi:BadF/BadG/BcrA/BcrD ATPase family protein [Mangrovibrevibacter kandeliae]|uniref:BadF/BadG/BcrA/BcrD ATPase family protein n=1 Tax=Mangrovibrevibacter kandeliae TaxID=2968473 RepID=UPI0021196642|nr:BadF/BadG/BcrA/BcrD ATPase family protein [Aurantimonas sp. CSK15Z-1]MCQ8781455.1 N-acetylglucosamine kinase [Aurantimonas sp. CSK15Z-1]
MTYVVGIDGGGTSCRVAIGDETGRILAQAQSGPANIRTDLEGAHANIVAATTTAAERANLSMDVLGTAAAVLGLAGGNVGRHAAVLRSMLPFRESRVVSDGLIALHGALGPHDGVIAILGTGSVFFVRRQGTVRSVGGWGFQVGDLASGARIGRQLLEETLLAFDGVRPGSPLTDRVMETFDGDPRRIVDQVRDATPGFYGSFAPSIVEAASAGDGVAEDILEAGRRDIERMLAVIVAPDTDRICLLGGLAPTYAARLSDTYLQRLKPPIGDALQGAVAMAAAGAASSAGSTT